MEPRKGPQPDFLTPPRISRVTQLGVCKPPPVESRAKPQPQAHFSVFRASIWWWHF